MSSQRTDRASQEGCETLLVCAPSWIFRYTDWMLRGAGTVAGRAIGALINAFRLLDSLDILRAVFLRGLLFFTAVIIMDSILRGKQWRIDMVEVNRARQFRIRWRNSLGGQK